MGSHIVLSIKWQKIKIKKYTHCCIKANKLNFNLVTSQYKWTGQKALSAESFSNMNLLIIKYELLSKRLESLSH